MAERSLLWSSRAAFFRHHLDVSHDTVGGAVTATRSVRWVAARLASMSSEIDFFKNQSPPTNWVVSSAFSDLMATTCQRLPNDCSNKMIHCLLMCHRHYSATGGCFSRSNAALRRFNWHYLSTILSDLWLSKYYRIIGHRALLFLYFHTADSALTA